MKGCYSVLTFLLLLMQLNLGAPAALRAQNKAIKSKKKTITPSQAFLHTLAKREREHLVYEGVTTFLTLGLIAGLLLKETPFKEGLPAVCLLLFLAVALITGGRYNYWQQTLWPVLRKLRPPQPTINPSLGSTIKELAEKASYAGFLLDLLLCCLLLLGAYRGYRAGFLSQLFSTFITVGFIAAAAQLFNHISRLLQAILPMAATSAPFLAFLVLFLFFLVTIFMLDKLIKYAMRLTILGYIDSLLGAAIGLLQTALFLSFLLALLEASELVIPAQYTSTSYCYQELKKMSPLLLHISSKLLGPKTLIWLNQLKDHH